jgi:eukaryotic-like serine/threonine-protein kinase
MVISSYEKEMNSMDGRIGKRYVSSSQIVTLHNASLHNGEDLFLNRNVIFYRIELEPGYSREEYVRRFKHTASFNHEGFLHILDTAFEERSVLIVLQLKPGKLLRESLPAKNWTFENVVGVISDLGISFLDAMEEQITGFSVTVDNLWHGENGRLSVINYWDEREPETQGAIGLCRLMIQLLSGSTEIPGPFESLHARLERIPIPTATLEQKESLVKLIKHVGQGQSSLSTLIFGLRKLQSASSFEEDDDDEEEIEEAEAPTAIQPPAPARAVRKFTLIKGLSFGAIGLFLVAVILTWVLWHSSSSKQNRQVSVTPSHSVKPVTDSSTPKQTQTPATNIPKNTDSNPENKEAIVPNLVGLSQADAEKQALAAGLHYNYLLEANSGAKGTVTKQNPAAGTKGLQGDNVTFWVSKGSP